uniref:Myb-like domain-containing protein n=1 Tax=Lactuca sativa TaxID=4236 RepID=A0A9R1XBM9_LACSA|nr:hypothetical protein LSAT_V11C500277630 [Lactuca sativa]
MLDLPVSRPRAEIQPSPSPQPKKKKGKKSVRPNTTQERVVPWTKDEEEKIVQAWISASQDPIEGDSQTFGCFWEKICAMFYELTGSESRNPYQISSKWRNILLKSTEFGGIYHNLLNIRKSRSNDFDVIKAALDQFEKITPTRKAFPYVKPWPKLKNAPKWKEKMEGSSQSSGSKHSRNPDATNNAKADQFGEKFDRYVHVQKTKADMLNRVEQKMIETQSVIQTKTDM